MACAAKFGVMLAIASAAVAAPIPEQSSTGWGGSAARAVDAAELAGRGRRSLVYKAASDSAASAGRGVAGSASATADLGAGEKAVVAAVASASAAGRGVAGSASATADLGAGEKAGVAAVASASAAGRGVAGSASATTDLGAGSEPKWDDGAHCAVGTTCKSCKNQATFWAAKGFTACGSEPKWGDGVKTLSRALGFECDESTNFITGAGYSQQTVCGSVAEVLEGCQAECDRMGCTAFFYQEHPNDAGCPSSPSGGYQICGFTTSVDFGTTRHSWHRGGSQVCRNLPLAGPGSV